MLTCTCVQMSSCYRAHPNDLTNLIPSVRPYLQTRCNSEVLAVGSPMYLWGVGGDTVQSMPNSDMDYLIYKALISGDN